MPNIPAESASAAAVREAQRRWIGAPAKWSAIGYLIALVVFILASPIVVELDYGRAIEGAMLTIVLISAVAAVSERWVTRLAAVMLVLPPVFCRWLHHYRPDLMPIAGYLAAGMVFLLFVLFHYFRYILRAPTVNFTVLCAAVSTYLMLGMLWTMSYIMLTSIRPDSFAQSGKPVGLMNAFDAFYFSFVTLSTVGYGDIVPASRPARMLAVLEATTGTLFVATLIARLVAIQASSRTNVPR